MHVLSAAKTSVTITSYTYSHEAIHEAIRVLPMRGVKVRFIQCKNTLMKGTAKGMATMIAQLVESGIEVRAWSLGKETSPDSPTGVVDFTRSYT